MNTNELIKVFSYMFEHGKMVFIDMYSSKRVQGFQTGTVDPETGKLVGKDSYIAFQCCSLTEGTGREVQLRSNHDCRQEVDARINLSDLIPEKQIVIITGGDSLYGIVPVLNDKLELVDYVRFLRDYYKSLPEDDQWSASRHLDDMERLAIWLYQNNPNEKKKSLIDEIEDKLN